MECSVDGETYVSREAIGTGKHTCMGCAGQNNQELCDKLDFCMPIGAKPFIIWIKKEAQ